VHAQEAAIPSRWRPQLCGVPGLSGRGFRAPALTLSWRRCRHSKRRRWKGAWWIHWLVSSRDGVNRSDLRRMAARDLRRNIIPDDMGIPSPATPGPIGGRLSEARPQLVREYNRSHYPVGHGLPSRPPDRTLFTRVRGIGVLGSSYPGSRITPDLTLQDHPYTRPARPRSGSACNTDGWICRILDAPSLRRGISTLDFEEFEELGHLDAPTPNRVANPCQSDCRQREQERRSEG
jgi:hypothetical protein